MGDAYESVLRGVEPDNKFATLVKLLAEHVPNEFAGSFHLRQG